MQEVVWQEKNSIEVIAWDELSQNEFKQIIHQFESLCTANPSINILFDVAGLNSIDFKIMKDEYDFFKNYKDKLDKVAIVTDNKFEAMVTNLFDNFTDVNFKVFRNTETDEARKWIFPSRLPG